VVTVPINYLYTGYQSNEWNTFEGYDTITDTGTTGTDTIVAKGTGNVDIGLKSFGVNSGIETIDGTGVTGKVTIVGDWSDNTLDFSNTAFVGDNIQINGYWGEQTPSPVIPAIMSLSVAVVMTN
jgi:hypothetical protein